MTPTLITAALLAASALAPSPSAPPPLSETNRALVRCAAAFAIVAHAQSLHDEDARRWPELGERGREFFARGIARVMDDTGMGRPAISRLMSSEAQRLRDEGRLDEVMPTCLVLLEASGV